MKLIPFPGSTAPKETKYKKIQPNFVKPSADKLLLSPIEITCVNCKTTNTLHLDGMIFRSIEFYCSTCGHIYKITNPAFNKM